jgi:Carbon storage regulator (could also regulate swarming and quorum sensing)
MLVLTRKSNQSIMIGDDVEVSVLSIMGRFASVFQPRATFRSSARRSTWIQAERGVVTAGGTRHNVDAELDKLGRG